MNKVHFFFSGLTNRENASNLDEFKSALFKLTEISFGSILDVSDYFNFMALIHNTRIEELSEFSARLKENFNVPFDLLMKILDDKSFESKETDVRIIMQYSEKGKDIEIRKLCFKHLMEIRLKCKDICQQVNDFQNKIQILKDLLSDEMKAEIALMTGIAIRMGGSRMYSLGKAWVNMGKSLNWVKSDGMIIEDISDQKEIEFHKDKDKNMNVIKKNG